MNLKNENIVEFLINDEFINFVIHPTLKLRLQWEAFFKKNPQLISAANQARMILYGEEMSEELPASETYELKKRIINKCGFTSLN